MKTIYENEEYFVCESIEDMIVKLLNHRKAILISNYSSFSTHQNEIFKIVGDHFGADSKELFNSSQPKLFCGNCGTPFSQVLFLKLINPGYHISGAPDKIESCPKCKSLKITVLYKL